MDHDPAERERTQRILALLQARETRDELGLGAIRDSFADQLFPGTSTIQTRLRYMLFVPWMYRRFEEEPIPAEELAARGRELELALVEPLIAEDGDPHGVFGRTARGDLKRLPSAVYWSGLRAWGIQRYGGSQGQYHQALVGIHHARKRRSRAPGVDDGAGLLATWHPKLPPEPPGFPQRLSLRLTEEEAEFLVDRIEDSQTESLLARLAAKPGDFDGEFPWEHPDKDSFDPLQRELLDHARLFSEAMFGAAVLYNLLLAEELPIGERKEKLLREHRDTFARWESSLDRIALRFWDTGRLWWLVGRSGDAITGRTRAFVETWVALAAEGARGLAENEGAKVFVRSRERYLKGPRSRFGNPSALEHWNGRAGMTRLSYRWPTAKGFLRELREAFGGR